MGYKNYSIGRRTLQGNLFVSDSVIATDKSLLKSHAHGLMSHLGLMFKLYHLHNLCL